jgi:hypothetical protein
MEANSIVRKYLYGLAQNIGSCRAGLAPPILFGRGCTAHQFVVILNGVVGRGLPRRYFLRGRVAASNFVW